MGFMLHAIKSLKENRSLMRKASMFKDMKRLQKTTNSFYVNPLTREEMQRLERRMKRAKWKGVWREVWMYFISMAIVFAIGYLLVLFW